VYARLDLGKAAPFEMQSVSQGPFGFVSAILNWGKAHGAERPDDGCSNGCEIQMSGNFCMWVS
jgi:hypothetical protein